MLNELPLLVPGRPYSKSHASRLCECECGQGVALSAHTHAQAAEMTLRAGTTRDWKREFISHFLLAGACAFWSASLLHELQLFVTDRLSRLLVLFKIQAVLQRSIFPPN